LERHYIRDVERPHGLPRARRQVCTVHGSRTEYKDALYEEFGVGVELDGNLAHPPEAHWRDRHRDNAAAADGIITLRYSWPDVIRRRCHVAAQVAAVLWQRGWRGMPRPCGPACPVRKS
jgi:very-short-patch-repair endonuclease